MQRKKVLSEHMKRLMSGVSVHGVQHLTEIETDLVQTALLLDEAIEKLGAGFMAMHAAVVAQDETVALLLEGKVPDEARIAALRAMPAEFAAHVNAAVTSMQFQDMTSQLIDRTLRRVSGLRDYLGTLAGGESSDGLPENNHDEIVEWLNSVRAALAIQSLELRNVLRKAVNQKHLESGDIELF